MHYYLVAANHNIFPFQRVTEEFMRYGTVNWEIIGKGNRHLNKGDLCFFYYTGIPDMQGRILFSAVVTEKVHNMHRSEIYGNDDFTVVPGFTVADLKPLTSQAASDYTLEQLIQEYGVNSVRPSVQRLNDHNSALISNLQFDTYSAELETFQDLQDAFFTTDGIPQ